jgi:hypothetical protein
MEGAESSEIRWRTHGFGEDGAPIYCLNFGVTASSMLINELNASRSELFPELTEISGPANALWIKSARVTRNIGEIFPLDRGELSRAVPRS